MKKTISYIITFCLIIIVVLSLLRNKKEINAQIAFAEQKVQAYPVKVEEVQTGVISSQLEVSGILSATQDLMLMAETQGRVETIFIKEGDWVKKGDAIAQVNDELMRAELMVTEANYEKAQRDLERANTLSDGGAITQQQLEGLQLNEKAAKAKYITSKKRLADARIKAPISGYVNKLFLKEGGMIGAGVPACELVNIRSLKMGVKADEQDIVKVFNGQKVKIKVDALNNVALEGTVVSIGSKADYALQYSIEIVIPENPEEQLKAGMVAKAIFSFQDEKDGAIIPKSALIGSIKNPEVYVMHENKAVLRAITIVESNDDQLKVSEGVSEGEQLIVAGQFNLQDGVNVKEIN